MKNKQKEFLKKLLDLMLEYNVTMGYTRDDDGIHLYMDSDEFHVSHMDDSEELRLIQAYNDHETSRLAQPTAQPVGHDAPCYGANWRRDMRLENWKKIDCGMFSVISGQIYGDTRGKFFDGETVTTSAVHEIVDGKAKTLNSEYVLGKRAP